MSEDAIESELKETLQPYKASHARIDALEFRLITVALLAENVPRSLFIEKRDLLLRDFFEVEKREYDSPYTEGGETDRVLYAEANGGGEADGVQAGHFSGGVGGVVVSRHAANREHFKRNSTSYMQHGKAQRSQNWGKLYI